MPNFRLNAHFISPLDENYIEFMNSLYDSMPNIVDPYNTADSRSLTLKCKYYQDRMRLSERRDSPQPETEFVNN